MSELSLDNDSALPNVAHDNSNVDVDTGKQGQLSVQQSRRVSPLASIVTLCIACTLVVAFICFGIWFVFVVSIPTQMLPTSSAKTNTTTVTAVSTIPTTSTTVKTATPAKETTNTSTNILITYPPKVTQGNPATTCSSTSAVTSVTESLFSSIVDSGKCVVTPAMKQEQIQALLDDPQCCFISFAPGVYTLECLRIARSNLILDGNMGATLCLPPGINHPNIVIGDIRTGSPVQTYNNIVVKNITLVGNKETSTNEFMTNFKWVANCCVFVTNSHRIVLDNCNFSNSASGGMTATFKCNDVIVSNCSSSNHAFDSFTAYTSSNLRFINNYSTDCINGAGLSVDNDCQYVNVANNSFVGNKLGVFARYSSDFVVTGNTISDNNEQGLFLSGYSVTSGNDKGCTRWNITGNNIANNGQLNNGHGLYMQSCNQCTVSGNIISNNSKDGIYIGSDGPTGTCSYNNISGNSITDNKGCGFNSNYNNSTTTGAMSNKLVSNVIENNTNGNIEGDVTAWTVA